LRWAPDEEVLRAAKYTGAFSGAIRPNLVALLDHVGLQHWLGIASCATLFGEHAHADARDRGAAQSGLRGGQELQRRERRTCSPRACCRTRSSAISRTRAPPCRMPCTCRSAPRSAWRSTGWRRAGMLDGERILHGIPHPSGANAERIAYFLGRKPRETLSSRTNGARIDADRAALRLQLARLGIAADPHTM
jgi:hypothetical protein